MKTILTGLAVLIGAMTATCDPPPPGPLSDQLIGKWLLEGTIGGKQATHDVDAEWVLNREYIRLHEVSRAKNADASAAFEAIIFLEWQAKVGEYVCLFLDSTEGGGISSGILARGKPTPDKIPLIFNLPGNEKIHTTLVYEKSSDTWQWLIDNEKDGKQEPFARLRMTRQK